MIKNQIVCCLLEKFSKSCHNVLTMSYRDLANIEEKIYEACCAISQKGGVEAISAQKIAKICHISTFAIFSRYKTIRGVVEATKETMSKRVTDKLMYLSSQSMDLGELFDSALDTAIKAKEKAIFMVSYIVTYGFNATKSSPDSYEITQAARIMFKDYKFEDDEQLLLAWDYLSSNLFYYAQKFIRKEIPDTPRNRARLRHMALDGVDNYIQKK